MKVKLKSVKQFKKMVRNKEIECLGCTDSGEITHYGTKGNPSHVMSIWWDQHEEEYLIVDHPNPISRESYKARKIFFEELEESNDKT